ncbi:MAG: sigma-70 family RNA polymerase sigma factor [Bacteroidota bacterium]
MTDRTDEELMALFQKGDAAAFTLLVRRYKDDLTNYVVRFVGQRPEAEDIVQETFVRVFRKKSLYTGVAKFSTWLYTIASNLAKTRLRRMALWRFIRLGSGGEHGPEFDLPDDSAQPDKEADEAIREERIQRALKALPVAFREVVVLRDIQGLSYEEITAITGAAMGTVKSRINRGRMQLREMLRDLWTS